MWCGTVLSLVRCRTVEQLRDSVMNVLFGFGQASACFGNLSFCLRRCVFSSRLEAGPTSCLEVAELYRAWCFHPTSLRPLYNRKSPTGWMRMQRFLSPGSRSPGSLGHLLDGQHLFHLCLCQSWLPSWSSGGLPRAASQLMFWFDGLPCLVQSI